MKSKVNFKSYSFELLAYFLKFDNNNIIIVNSNLPHHVQREAIARMNKYINSNYNVGVLKKGFIFFGYKQGLTKL